jgi:hypothetical protein
VAIEVGVLSTALTGYCGGFHICGTAGYLGVGSSNERDAPHPAYGRRLCLVGKTGTVRVAAASLVPVPIDPASLGRL